MEQRRKDVGQERHDEILGTGAKKDIFRSLEDQGEIVDAHGHAHAEHDDAEEDGENGNTAHLAEDPGKARRQGHADDEEDDGDDAEIFTDKGTDFFHDECLFFKTICL